MEKVVKLLFLVNLFAVWSTCTNGFRWVKGAYEGTVFANRSLQTVFRWKYELSGTLKFSVQCGYLHTDPSTGVQDLITLVKKAAHNSDMQVGDPGKLPGSIDSSIAPFQQVLEGGQVDRSVIGFTILRPTLTHPKLYRCKAIYNNQDAFSEHKKLVVLDPPKLEDCLQGLPAVDELANLRISCAATGNPQPNLQCTLYTSQWRALQRIPKIATLSSIVTQTFQRVDRDAEFVVCLADGGEHTGTANVTEPIIVNHTPRAPDNVRFLPAFNHSMINVQWSEIPMNETGGALLGYKIIAYDSTIGVLSGVSVTLLIDDIKPDFTDELGMDYYRHELAGVDPLVRYTVRVIGFNRVGDGRFIPDVEVTPSKIQVRRSTSDDDSSVGVIIGGIIAGIVFIVIFVVLAVWCSTRSKKHEKFPTSHVEDAVDYPAGVGQSLYASVDKNRNKQPPRADSVNEYPDVVNDTSEPRPLATSPSYEASNKSFV